MNTIYIVGLYLIVYVISYYLTRWIIKKEYDKWDWTGISLVALVCSIGLLIIPLVGALIIYPPKIKFKLPNPPKWLVIIPIILASCSPKYSYYIQPGVMTFKGGKYTFKCTDSPRLIPDTTILGYLIMKK